MRRKFAWKGSTLNPIPACFRYWPHAARSMILDSPQYGHWYRFLLGGGSTQQHNPSHYEGHSYVLRKLVVLMCPFLKMQQAPSSFGFRGLGPLHFAGVQVSNCVLGIWVMARVLYLAGVYALFGIYLGPYYLRPSGSGFTSRQPQNKLQTRYCRKLPDDLTS